ncbi:O-antigen ligase family protein [Capillimicrobium parvum]|nr:O-antigen ligase family protein [Capillimicrobium parvum]
MSTFATDPRRSMSHGADRRLLPLLAGLASIPAGMAMALALYRYPPAPAIAVGAGAGLVCLLALTLANLHAAVALGVVLLGVVAFEPAPSDAVFFAVIAVSAVTGRLHLRAAPGPAIGILVVLGALNVISAMQVADPQRAALFFSITMYLAIFALWLPSYVVSRPRAQLILRAYVVAAVTSAVIGVAALLALIPGAELFTESSRARALFQDPNVFGPFLIPALLMVLEEIPHPRLLRSGTVAKAVLSAILAVGVLFSYSRGAWLNLAVGLAVMVGVLALRRGGARQALAFVAVASCAAAVVVAIVIATGAGGFLAERARPQTYDTQRFSGQRAGLQPAEEYPLGAGPGQFESIAGISAHSTYARVVGEQGFLGLAALIAFLGYTLLAAIRNAAAGRSTFGIGSAALLGAWCGMLANSAVIDTLHWRHLWLVAGLIWAGAALSWRRSSS